MPGVVDALYSVVVFFLVYNDISSSEDAQESIQCFST